MYNNFIMKNYIILNVTKNHKQVPFKNNNRDVPNEGTPTFLRPQILSINTINTNNKNDTSSFSLIKVQIGSNLSLSLNLIPDISSNYISLSSQLCYNDDSCNNRINYYDSENSTTFNGILKTEIINYLDGSNVSALIGYDYISLDKYKFKSKSLLSLFDEINGTLKTQSAVEGIMGLGFGSSIWNQLASDNYLQIIGIALPNFICSIGSIAIGGIDLRYIFNDPTNFYNIPTLNDTNYSTIKVNTIWVNNTSLNVPTINAIISTNYDKISLGNFSTEFFTKLGANKTNDGNWIVPDPVDIIFDVETDSELIIGLSLSGYLTCNSMIKGQCISIFDDEFGPLNNTIIIGALFIKNYYITANKTNNASHSIGIAVRNEDFCPIPGPTGAQPASPQTTILPKPTPTFPPPKILELNTFNLNNQNQSLEYLFQVQIGSNSSLNIMPDTSVNDIGVCSELCNQSSTSSCHNRQHLFNSRSSSSFSQNGTKVSVNYLDWSSSNGLFGNDFIILDHFEFATKFAFLLFNQINGALQAESAVEASKGHDQAIGFAFPNSPCPVGSIAFGGLDPRFCNKVFNTDANEIFSLPILNDSIYPKIVINTIWVNNTSINFSTSDAIISTNYNKASLGNYSTEFFKALGAKKTSDRNWVVPNPVDITFDLMTDSGLLIGVIIPRLYGNLTCNMIRGQCISVFDDSSGPSDSTQSIILAKSIIEIANRNNFCPTKIHTTTVTSTKTDKPPPPPPPPPLVGSMLSWDMDTDSGQSGTGRPGHVRPEFFLSQTFGD
ncbi:aspartic peptidase domain-containing protein [Gigaspora rosea]|uniref:Aspartic peptidase domain-containing protein n=1 Tax=Gigaspora rosea TaxID=44941 RepID=A0A397VJC3_9GLOM|nr:aspartic peptidase domain-containing protein [Gigaspora rosea]